MSHPPMPTPPAPSPTPPPAPPSPTPPAPAPTPAPPSLPAPGSTQPPADPTRPHGFPLETPLAQMTDSEQAAYWKYYARQHEQRANQRADYDDLKAKAEAWEQHQAQSATEQEKAIAAAKAEAQQALLPGLVTAHFKAELAGRLLNAEGNFDDARLASVLAPLDLKYFTDSSGNVDPNKVREFATTIAPAQQQTPGQPGGQFPDLGQGFRAGQVKASVAAGAAMYAAQRKPQGPPAAQ